MRISKRLYIGLLLASLLVTALVFFGVYNLMRFQEYPLFRTITIGLAGVFICGFILVAAGIAALVLSIIREKSSPTFEGCMRIATTFLFPIAVNLGKLFGIGRERVWASFIEVNNYLVRTRRNLAVKGRLVILAPHCLQESNCPVKITTDINNCRRCGKCDICGLLELADKYGVALRVATGGTLARKIIGETRPQGVVAIACERDLSLGIKDANPLPVIGVLNQRPYGPCQDTRVDLSRVEEALMTMLGGG
ncbi:MAG: DUF116 domain-containing protein [Syntrophomonadaceae bacterium]|nr:DUF116 domain-containing protein [Syntrophomonadaceae bacterium]